MKIRKGRKEAAKSLTNPEESKTVNNH